MLESPPTQGAAFVLTLCTTPRDYDTLYYRTSTFALYGYAQMMRDARNATPVK